MGMHVHQPLLRWFELLNYMAAWVPLKIGDPTMVTFPSTPLQLQLASNSPRPDLHFDHTPTPTPILSTPNSTSSMILGVPLTHTLTEFTRQISLLTRAQFPHGLRCSPGSAVCRSAPRGDPRATRTPRRSRASKRNIPHPLVTQHPTRFVGDDVNP